LRETGGILLFIIRLLAPLLLAGLAYWGLRRLQQRYTLTTQQFRWLAGLTAALVIILILIVMGRLPIQALAAPLLFVITFALRNAKSMAQLLTLLKLRKPTAAGTSGPGAGNAGVSSIRTAWLMMELTHSTGQMDGEVLKGRFQGQRLSAMDLESLLALARECQHDADSMQLLEAYLDRMQPDWKQHADAHAGQTGRSRASESSMTEALALEILGLEPGATREQITAAHRRLMQKMHPDRGGSDYLAQRINEARDFLLD
jgi:hypothetical protein